MRKHGKVDANQPAIVAALRKAGVSVAITSDLGDGFLDLCVSKKSNGVKRTVLLECKTGKKDLNDDQKFFVKGWQGEYYVVRSPEEAVRLFE